MKILELTPVNGRKSFYGKCRVEERTAERTLYSYNTKIATFNTVTNRLTWLASENHLTNTTLTHIRSFLSYCGLPSMTKKEIIKNI